MGTKQSVKLISGKITVDFQKYDMPKNSAVAVAAPGHQDRQFIAGHYEGKAGQSLSGYIPDKWQQLGTHKHKQVGFKPGVKERGTYG